MIAPRQIPRAGALQKYNKIILCDLRHKRSKSQRRIINIMQTLNTIDRIILDLEMAIDDITLAAGKLVPGSFAQVQLHKSAERVSIVIEILKVNSEAII